MPSSYYHAYFAGCALYSFFLFLFLIKSSGIGSEKLSCQVVGGLMHVNVII